MKHYYCNERNTLILIALLKKYNIKKIIVSPGATNVSFVYSCQQDGFFEMFSAVDERSAAFMACGMAEQCNEPVVLSCTGATASRNYIPGLTKAFYERLPIIAVTSTLNIERINYYVPQLIDRTTQFEDLVDNSYQLRRIDNKEDENAAITNLNYYLHFLFTDNKGPLHINLFTNYTYNFNVKKLPNVIRIFHYTTNDMLPEIRRCKIGIFIGNHKPFSLHETDLIDKFCSYYDAIVICDHTSNYQGNYKFLASLSNSQEKILSSRFFDIIIHIGYVSGSYINFHSKEIWRVNPDGHYRNVFNNLSKVFEMEESYFFEKYTASSTFKHNQLLLRCKAERESLLSTIDKTRKFPFSNILIAKELSKRIPSNSILHLGILNSLRAWNFFDIDKTINVYCNTGGFGIDGCMSSAIGSSYESDNSSYFLVLGDLAFFYDINSLLQTKPKNLHILVINNGIGCEFKNYNHRASIFGEKTDEYIAAKNHNGKKSNILIKDFCRNQGIDYYSCSNEDEFLNIVNNWIFDTNLTILEAFTTDGNESKALKIINSIQKDFKIRIINFSKKIIKNILRR